MPTDAGQLLEPLTESALLVAESLSALDDSWTIYTRPRLGLDIIDFLAVHDQHGVCAITALDWGPGTRQVDGDGGLVEVDDTGASTPVADSPRFAAHRHRNNIFDRSFALPSDGTEPTSAVRAAVIAPRLSDLEAVRVLDPQHHDESQSHVEVWGHKSLHTDLERILIGTGCSTPLPQSIARVRRLIAPSERVTERPAPLVRSAGTQAVEMNTDSIAIRRFRGAAGSGKSFALAARAARLASQGKRVLVLSFNVTLANRLSSLVSDRCAEYGANPTGVTCTNFHSYCTRVVQDAEIAGFETAAPKGARWTQAIVAKALMAFEAGFDDRYDAVLVDEGQDFTLRWWNMLRNHALVADGEMALMVDPALDLYDRNAWADEDALLDAGFSDPWVDLDGAYRMPGDLMQLASEFAADHLGDDAPRLTTADDHQTVAGDMAGSARRWTTVDQVGDTGIAIGTEVVRLLQENPSLSPGDVAFICDYHHDGVAAARRIEAAGYHVHHIFSRDPDDARRRRKYRFSPTAGVVKGSTIHSFKGWETPVLVMGIGVETGSKRVAFAAMTRVVGSTDRPAVISVISADKRLDGFREQFVADSVPIPDTPPAPAHEPDALAGPAHSSVVPPASAHEPVAVDTESTSTPAAAPSTNNASRAGASGAPRPAASNPAVAPAAATSAPTSSPAGAPSAAVAVSVDADIVPSKPNRPLSEPSQPDVLVTGEPEPDASHAAENATEAAIVTEAEPQPQTCPEVAPESEAQPESEVQPEPEAQPEPQPEPEVQPEASIETADELHEAPTFASTSFAPPPPPPPPMPAPVVAPVWDAPPVGPLGDRRLPRHDQPTEAPRTAHRIGIIGLGTVGSRFVEQFNQHSDFELVAAWDPDADACGAHADSVTITDDAAAVVAASDAVYVAVPPLFHREYVEACIAANVAVFCEKPLGVDVEESRALVELVEASSVPAGVNFVFSAAPAATELIARIERGEIGDVVRGDLRLHFTEWPRAWHAKAQWLRLRDQGGWMREVVSHFLFVAARTLGPLSVERSAVTYPDGPAGELSEVDAVARLTSTSDAPLMMIGTSEGAGPDVVDLTIRGTKGSLRLLDWYHLQRTTGTEWQHVFGTDRAELGANAYASQLGELSKMFNGEPNTIATFTEALAVQELVEQMLDADNA